MEKRRDNIFISYCREDSRWLEMFRRTLAPLLRQEQLKIWDDTKITPGSKWQKEIENAVASSRVALLLVSAHFLASDFIIDYELPLLNGARADGLTVLWVAVSHCMYQFTDLRDEQALTDPAKPLDSLTPTKLNQVLVHIGKRIKKVMDSPPPQNSGETEDEAK
jgi:internalin A